MNVEELKALLDDFGDHLEVRICYDQDKDLQQIETVDTAYYNGEIYLVLEGR